MRAVIQRVDRACVRINSQLFSDIDHGLLVLLGVEKDDSEKDADLFSKRQSICVFSKMNRAK